jgi:PAS domain S-box-containing protein
LRLALKAAEQGMFDINLKTGDMTTTPDFAQLMGYDADTHYENYDTWIERIHPDDRKIIAKIFKQFKNSKQSEFRAEYRQRKADGNFAWILSVGKVIEYDKDGTPLRLLGTNLDITSAKSRMQLYRKARSVSAACSKMPLLEYSNYSRRNYPDG